MRDGEGGRIHHPPQHISDQRPTLLLFREIRVFRV